MNLLAITCSDPKENNDPRDIVELLRMSSLVELGVQAHDGAMNRGLPRFEWFESLLRLSENWIRPFNIAMHVNGEWCADFCNGKLAPELESWMSSGNKNTNKPTIKRWQLNIMEFMAYDFITPGKTADVIDMFPDREFIFPYNKELRQFIYELKEVGAKFSLLFDASYGVGKGPEKWDAPVFEDVPQGYAGGLCAKNLDENLNEISALVPTSRDIWIDAEGNLMGPGTRKFDIGRARAYVNAALKWAAAHTA